jgi:hypothetical protein
MDRKEKVIDQWDGRLEGGYMQHEDIRIERNHMGIFAIVESRVFSVEATDVIIWSKAGKDAEAYMDKSDEEIRVIALHTWTAINESRLRRKRPSAK